MPEIEFELFKFPGGELHIKLNKRIDYNDIEKVIISHRIHNMDDLMAVLIAKDALERKGVKHFDLIMPYIPYARQDRFYDGESFTLQVFTDLLNSAKFEAVHVFDAHSLVSRALIKNCVHHPNTPYVRDVLADFTEELILISPDAGASKKTSDLAVELGLMVVQGGKKRDTSTGELSGFEVHTHNLYGADCLIVDDICDGGGTFVGLAEQLKRKGAGSVHLFVTHGIFSKGFDVFKGVIDSVYCTDSFSTLNDPAVVQKRLFL